MAFITRTMVLAVTALTFALTLPARSLAEPEGHGESTDDAGHEGLVELTEAELKEFGIEIEAAGQDTIVKVVAVPGEIHPNANRLADIVPRYTGIVIEVRANIGDQVQKGQVLAVLEGDQSLAPFEMVTMISGTVIERHLTLGEASGRGTTAFVVADLSAVWIDLTVYQRDLDRIRVGQDVDIHVGHEFGVRGKISYVTPVLNAQNRAATARVVIDNRAGRWRPGMFVTGKIEVDRAVVPVAVPLSALHQINQETVVFVRTEEGFVPRHVKTGREDSRSVEILDGLTAGENYVSRGGFTLKAELGKESFGEGHAH